MFVKCKKGKRAQGRRGDGEKRHYSKVKNKIQTNFFFSFFGKTHMKLVKKNMRHLLTVKELSLSALKYIYNYEKKENFRFGKSLFFFFKGK